MLKLGLVGKNISHSKSKNMYESILNERVDYYLFDYSEEVDIPCLNEIFNKVSGLSITSPYKTHFLKNVVMEKSIEHLQAINCISKRSGKFFATNTDYLAVRSIIKKEYSSKNIILLGDGVMAKVTLAAIKELGLSVKQYSRREDGDLNKVDLMGPDSLVINACGRSFEFNNKLGSDSIFWDYNYSFNPHEQYFKGDSRYIDGLSLLHLQAKYALEFWEITN